MFDKYKRYGNIKSSHMRRTLIIAFLCFASFGRIPAPDIFADENKDVGAHCNVPLQAVLKAIDEYRNSIRYEEPSKPATARPTDASKDTATKGRKDEGTKGRIEKTEKAEKLQPEKIRILKEATTERIGAQEAYEEFAGLRFGKYFTVGQRVEIYQEARPIDAYILDAKSIRYLGVNNNGRTFEWKKPVEFRSQITPLFTRAYGTQFTLDNPNDPSGQIAQIRYTIDYRDTYRQYYPKWPHLLWYNWLQHEVILVHSRKIPGINWYYTSNLGYRYSTIVEKDTNIGTPTNAGYENRHTYLASLSIAPSARFEWFGQFEYFKSKRPRSSFVYSPDHWYYKTELRFKSEDMRTSLIPSLSYSKDYYWPFKDTFQKYEMALRLGHDFTSRLSATSQLEYVLSIRDEPDNKAPEYGTTPHPIKDMAAYVGTKNRVSYNVWNDFYMQGGLDFAAGTNMSDFDNYGTFLGLEYYKPGWLRANVGWNTNWYYNIDDFLNTIGFKCYVFM